MDDTILREFPVPALDLSIASYFNMTSPPPLRHNHTTSKENKMSVNVNQWVDMFRAVGLGDTEMEAWHAEFERRHPQDHQSFLEWLQLPAKRIADVRRRAAGGGL